MELKNVCIVGCGDRGRAHAEAWARHPEVRVVAVSDTDEERARSLAASTGAKAFDDWREAIVSDGVNVVSQCVPSVLHAEVTCFAAEHGCHVFGEKPLALNLDQGEQILKTVRHTGIICMPCFQYRDRWIHERYRNAFREGALGHSVVLRHSGVSPVRPKTAMHRRSVNGGPLIDMACHYIDLLRWITGAEPRRVFAAGHVFGGDKKHLDGIDDLAVDEACVEVTYTDGHQLQLYLNWGMPEGFTSHSEGFLVGPSGLMRSVSGGLEWRSGGEVKVVKQSEVHSDPGLAVRTERFIRAIERNEPPDITCEDAMIALKVSHAALQSIESREAVEVGS